MHSISADALSAKNILEEAPLAGAFSFLNHGRLDSAHVVSAPPRNMASTLLKRATAFVALVCAAAAAASLAVHLRPADMLPGARWLLGLAVHWQWLYLVAGGTAAAVWLTLGDRRALLAALPLVAAWHAHSPAAGRADSDAGPVLQLATANLNVANQELAPLQRWLLGADAPDIVVLQEFNHVAAQLASSPALLARYPHQMLVPALDPFGLAILSRHPLVSVERIEPADPLQTLRLRAVVRWQERELGLSAVHPMPPLNAGYAAARDAALASEARWLGESPRPGVLAGDLNDTPWSTGLHGVKRWLGRASTLAPSWPVGTLPLLPLDHVLVTPQWQVVTAGAGPDLGSDHQPVVVTLTLGGERPDHGR